MRAHVQSASSFLMIVFAVVVTGCGMCGTAFAQVPPPDPVLMSPPSPVPLTAGPSTGQEVHWMLSGAGITVLIAGLAAAAAVLSRRHRVSARRLRVQ
jgi:hypothetical protein